MGASGAQGNGPGPKSTKDPKALPSSESTWTRPPSRSRTHTRARRSSTPRSIATAHGSSSSVSAPTPAMVRRSLPGRVEDVQSARRSPRRDEDPAITDDREGFWCTDVLGDLEGEVEPVSLSRPPLEQLDPPGAGLADREGLTRDVQGSDALEAALRVAQGRRESPVPEETRSCCTACRRTPPEATSTT